MREILFRLRDAKTKKIISSSDHGISMTLETGQLYINGHNVTDRYIKEQYTGRKDGNGKKIFEGDKLIHGGLVVRVYWDHDDLEWTVKFDEGGSLSLCEVGGTAVIGTIHDKAPTNE